MAAATAKGSVGGYSVCLRLIMVANNCQYPKAIFGVVVFVVVGIACKYLLHNK